MSHYPNSVLKRAGYKTQKDLRDKNVKKKCPFCPKEFVFSCYGPHILRHHLDDLFNTGNQSTINKKSLTIKKHIREPIPIDVGEGEELYGCLGCLSIFQKPATAYNHFKSKKESCQHLHQTNILALQEKYPITNTPAPKTNMKNKSQLLFFVESLIERVRELETKHKEEKMDYEEKYGRYFEDWGMNFSEEELSKEWEFLKQKEEPKESTPVPTPPSEPEEDELLPLVYEKPLTKEEVIKKLLSEQEIAEIARLEKKESPANQMNQPKIKRGAKRTDDQTTSQPLIAPPPPPPPSNEKDEKMKQMEAQLLEYEKFSKMTPWQKLVNANPSCSIQDLIRLAASSGIKPDAGASFKIVGNTKRTN